MLAAVGGLGCRVFRFFQYATQLLHAKRLSNEAKPCSFQLHCLEKFLDAIPMAVRR